MCLAEYDKKRTTIEMIVMFFSITVFAVVVVAATAVVVEVAYATSTTPTLPFVSYDEIGEPQKALINETIEQVRKAIIHSHSFLLLGVYSFLVIAAIPVLKMTHLMTIWTKNHILY